MNNAGPSTIQGSAIILNFLLKSTKVYPGLTNILTKMLVCCKLLLYLQHKTSKSRLGILKIT